MNGYAAPRGMRFQEQARQLPEFQVVKADDTIKKFVYDYEVTETEENGKKRTRRRLVKKEVEVDGGWIVYSPKGNVTRITSEAELVRLGLHRRPGVVNIGEGDEEEVLPAPIVPDLAELSKARETSRTRRRPG